MPVSSSGSVRKEEDMPATNTGSTHGQKPSAPVKVRKRGRRKRG
ncbi:MAG: hypothetical protein WC750_04690 [Patescibacteria group bacterium]